MANGLLFAAVLISGVCNLLVPALHVKSQGRNQLQHCSLQQHAQAELRDLWNRRVKVSDGVDSCSSFLQLQVRAQSKVRQGVDYVHFVQGDLNNTGRTAVWINGYPRSGSSTILSMVAAAGEERQDTRSLGKTFSIFEPCHDGDAYTPWLEAQGCGRLLAGLAQCDFTGVEQLWGWPDAHTTSNHEDFSQEAARNLCEKSQLTAFKTVDYGHNISDWNWFLEATPALRIVDIVRDPRGIYASWKTTEPFSSLIGTPEFYTLADICESFRANIELEHAQVHHVVFEELTRDPATAMRKVYMFLGLSFEAAQEQWLSKTFNAQKCAEPKPWEVGFTDCHEDSDHEAEKWRDILSDEEKNSFAESESCQKVVKAYGYPQE